jgi:hypothetical protein
LRAPSPRFPAKWARVVNENPPHGLGRDPEEVRAVLPFHRPLIDELEEGLVDEGGGLQGVVRALLSEVAGREFPQLPVDLRHQPIERLLLPIAPLLQKPGDLGRGTVHFVRISRLARE